MFEVGTIGDGGKRVHSLAAGRRSAGLRRLGARRSVGPSPVHVHEECCRVARGVQAPICLTAIVRRPPPFSGEFDRDHHAFTSDDTITLRAAL